MGSWVGDEFEADWLTFLFFLIVVFPDLALLAGVAGGVVVGTWLTVGACFGVDVVFVVFSLAGDTLGAFVVGVGGFDRAESVVGGGFEFFCLVG